MIDAVIVCDMWDVHWSPAALRRADGLALRLADFLKAARNHGAIVIHSPGECMDFYRDHPGRRLAVATEKEYRPTELIRSLIENGKKENLPAGMKSSCHSLPGEPALMGPESSRDDTQQELDDWKSYLGSRGYKFPFPWTRQTDLIPIAAGDYVTDIGHEVWSALAGLERVALVGIHTDLCVAARPYGLRRLVKIGKQVTLVGDLTDTLCCDLSLALDHVARYICPVAESSAVLSS